MLTAAVKTFCIEWVFLSLCPFISGKDIPSYAVLHGSRVLIVCEPSEHSEPASTQLSLLRRDFNVEPHSWSLIRQWKNLTSDASRTTMQHLIPAFRESDAGCYMCSGIATVGQATMCIHISQERDLVQVMANEQGEYDIPDNSTVYVRCDLSRPSPWSQMDILPAPPQIFHNGRPLHVQRVPLEFATQPSSLVSLVVYKKHALIDFAPILTTGSGLLISRFSAAFEGAYHCVLSSRIGHESAQPFASRPIVLRHAPLLSFVLKPKPTVGVLFGPIPPAPVHGCFLCLSKRSEKFMLWVTILVGTMLVCASASYLLILRRYLATRSKTRSRVVPITRYEIRESMSTATV